MLTYTDPTTVTEVKVTDAPVNRSVTGYGSKVPTCYMLKVGARWHRVYAMCYGNAASAYVIKGGVVLHLDTDTEHRVTATVLA